MIINDTVRGPFTWILHPGEGGKEGGREEEVGAGLRGEEGEGNMRERKVGETRIISLTLDVAFFSMATRY